MPADLRKKTEYFPHSPGCYIFKDTDGVVLYVGKAKDLRKRTSQYFGQDKRPQLPFLVEEAKDIDYIVARSELEALFLENTLIKKHNPKYNIKLKDDKNYAFIAISYKTPIPQIGYVRKITEGAEFTPFVNPSASWGSGKHETKRLIVTRTLKNKQPVPEPKATANKLQPNAYFGPYSSAKKIRETLDFVRKIFPYCANTEVSTRPCFYYHLHRCPGVCIGNISLDEYGKNLHRIELFLNGKTVEVKKELKSSMQSAAKSKHFELAARLRDELKALELLEQRQLAQFPNKVNYDFISLANKGALYCVNLFKVRDGKLTDKENFAYSTPKAATELSTSAAHAGQEYRRKIIQTFTSNYYIDATDLPDKVLLQDAVEDPLLIEQLLKHRKNKIVKVEVPKRGKAHQLVLLGQTNAEEYLRKQLATDANDLDKLKEALATLQTALALPTLPRRIECYDMSNTQGTNPVGSMVVFIDGKPAKSEYRKFKIRSKDTPDDFAMMRETLTRRLGRLIDPDKPWPKPDLIVIDGGKGQLSAALDAQMSFLEANSFKLEAISMIGLAKRIEEIFLPNNPEPIILSHTEPALQMLQRLRDEAHRFGITFHRQLRSKQATKSALDSIPGVGPKTKKLLKQKFGTVANVKAASLEDLAAVVGAQKAETIKKNL